MIKAILDKIFLHEDHATFSIPSKLSNVESYIICVLEAITASQEWADDVCGRIGPKKTIFDVDSNVGAFIVDKDRLGVSSQSNFSTIRANTCVYQGRWQYELMLGSKGVMQVGWTTTDGQFSQEKGVGDTPNSFAFDGNRVRKWNVATNTYGEGWLTGDVVGCTIDLDEGIVSFYRNGHHLGEAFSNVCLGPGLGYFPAVSLAYSESLVANFGANPFKYPVDGYRPLQEPPLADVVRSDVCLSWLRKIINLHPNASTCRVDGLSPKSALLIVASHIFQQLGPHLTSFYVVEASLIPFLMQLRDAFKSNQIASLNEDEAAIVCCPVNIFLDLLWSFADETEIRTCLDNVAVALLTGYRFSSTVDGYHIQKLYLNFTIVVLRHLRTRHYLLQNVLFDKIMFPVFLYVKPPDDECLKITIPSVWWDDEDPVESDKLDELNEDDQELPLGSTLHSKENYFAAVSNLHRTVADVEQLQVELLLLLMDDAKLDSKSASSLSMFASKFREFLKENMVGSRMVPVHLCPLPVSLCFFHCLVRAVFILWDDEGVQQPVAGTSFRSERSGDKQEDRGPPAYIRTEHFFNGSVNYFENDSSEAGRLVGHMEVRRLGGLASHLRKIHAKDCASSMSSCSHPNSRQAALVEILDGMVLLYHIAVHKQLGKMCLLRDTMHEYVTALADCKDKLANCKAEPEYESVNPVLQHSSEVFTKKLCEQGRHMAWVKAIVYSPDKRANVEWLLEVVLRTLETASQAGNLFSFLPDFYIDVCINSCSSLTNFFSKESDAMSPTTATTLFPITLVRVATFLSDHFMDKRIISADVKDNLVQALASFVCKTSTLAALESIPTEGRVSFVRKLLQPYENRAWAQSNWILLRLWKGCGFGFRYKQAPHLLRKLGPKLRHVDTSLPNQFHKPCPSVIYQEHVAEALLANVDGAVAFLNSILNQLNWAFSEFVGMLQEIQNASNCTGRVFIDSRQLKICSTCFDLAVALLRVLEMVVTVAPTLLTDWTRMSSAEPLLTRMCQLLCQVLNRVTSRSSCFDLVVSLEIQGLDSIDHFPIIAAVVGILVRITLDSDPKSCECATNALLAEPSFQLSSLEFVLGMMSSRALVSPTPLNDPASGSPSHNSVGHGTRMKIFSLRNYDEVSQSEIEKVERLIQHLWIEHSKAIAEMKDTAEDDLCPICYAHAVCAIFQPCGHQSCRACISHHLMNKTDCFFCKSNIEMVISIDGAVLHDLKQKQAKLAF